MKQQVSIIDQSGKILRKEFNTRNESMFKASLSVHSNVFVPKKGKGSFKRNKTVNYADFE